MTQTQLKDLTTTKGVEGTTDQERRKFMEKFGKLALVTPVAVTALMSPHTSAAPKSCGGNGRKKC